MQSKKTDFQLFIINKFKSLRQEHQLNQMQICEIIGLNSVGQIGNIESPRFKHKYTLEQIYKLSQYFNIPIEQIFLDEDEMEQMNSDIIKKLIIKIIEYNK